MGARQGREGYDSRPLVTIEDGQARRRSGWIWVQLAPPKSIPSTTTENSGAHSWKTLFELFLLCLLMAGFAGFLEARSWRSVFEQVVAGADLCQCWSPQSVGAGMITPRLFANRSTKEDEQLRKDSGFDQVPFPGFRVLRRPHQ